MCHEPRRSWKSFGLSTLIGAATGELAKAFAPQISNGITWVTSRVFRISAWRRSRVEIGKLENVPKSQSTIPDETTAPPSESAPQVDNAQPKLDAPTSESVSSEVAKVAEEATKGVAKTLQTGGNTLNKATLKALNLTKEQGKIAIEGLKKDLGLRSDFHGKILSNGDLVDPKNNQVVGNLFDYIYIKS